MLKFEELKVLKKSFLKNQKLNNKHIIIIVIITHVRVAVSLDDGDK